MSLYPSDRRNLREANQQSATIRSQPGNLRCHALQRHNCPGAGQPSIHGNVATECSDSFHRNSSQYHSRRKCGKNGGDPVCERGLRCDPRGNRDRVGAGDGYIYRAERVLSPGLRTASGFREYYRVRHLANDTYVCRPGLTLEFRGHGLVAHLHSGVLGPSHSKIDALNLAEERDSPDGAGFRSEACFKLRVGRGSSKT